MQRITRTVAVALLGTTVVLGTGCGKVAEKATETATEKAIEAQGGGDTDIDINDDGEVSIKTGDGSLEIGTGEVPEAWPDDIGFPDGLVVSGGMTLGDTGSGENVSVTATYDGDASEVVDFYKDELSDWTITSDSNMTSDGGSFVSASFENGDRTVVVSASGSSDGETAINLSHSTEA